MAIKINWSDLQKRIISWNEVQKVMLNWIQIRPTVTPSSTYIADFATAATSQTLPTWWSIVNSWSVIYYAHQWIASNNGAWVKSWSTSGFPSLATASSFECIYRFYWRPNPLLDLDFDIYLMIDNLNGWFNFQDLFATQQNWNSYYYNLFTITREDFWTISPWNCVLTANYDFNTLTRTISITWPWISWSGSGTITQAQSDKVRDAAYFRAELSPWAILQQMEIRVYD